MQHRFALFLLTKYGHVYLLFDSYLLRRLGESIKKIMFNLHSSKQLFQKMVDTQAMDAFVFWEHFSDHFIQNWFQKYSI